MTPIRPPLRRAALAALLGLAVLGLSLAPAPGQEKAVNKEQIEKIKQEIAELQKKLAAIEKGSTSAGADPTKRPSESALPEAWTKALSWRCIGPASMGGRIVALSVFAADPTTYWIATASGGLLKTSNNGVTFEHQFDKEATVSIGDVCVAPSNKEIVWVGTGENNPRNSVSYGDGVYKSTDGGKTWKNMGLKKTFQIGRVVVHPVNPDTVYVGALGRLYGPSEERGLYKTTDGGKSWTKLPLQTDENTGVIDIQMSPAEPDTLLVATWERRRDGFDSHAGALAGPRGANAPRLQPALVDGYDAYDPIKKWGKGGIYKTTDGGKSFRKLVNGLPTNPLGRVGLDFYRKDPKIVYAIIDCSKIGMGTVAGYLGVVSQNAAKGGARIEEVTENSPAATAGLKAGDVVVSADKKEVKVAEEFRKMLQKTKPGQKIALDLLRDGKPMTMTVTLGERPQLTGRFGPGGQRGGRAGGRGGVQPARMDFRTQEVKGVGVRVMVVFPEGTSAQAGLLVGDLIVAIDKKKVATGQDVIDAFRNLAPGGKLIVKVSRGAQTKDLTLATPSFAARRSATRPYTALYGGQRENVQDVQGPDGHEYGGVYRSNDGGDTWTRVNSVNPRPMYFSLIRVDPSYDKRIYIGGVNMYRSTDGGKTFRSGGDRDIHPDHHALWIDPRDGRHMLIGTDGGTYATYDRGEKWDYLNTMAVGQFYHVAVDNRRPYRVYGGLQDNGSWGGPSHTLDGRGPINADWVMVQGGDGFVCRVDPNDPDVVYSESQEGNLGRRNLKTGQTASIKPRAPAGQPPYRFNWNTPFILSSHNPSIVYVGGNFVFRSYKRGEDPRPISPELTKNAQASATAVAESPRSPDVLWAGTDDGTLWVTNDGGGKWENVASKVGLPKPYWVSTIEPSRHANGRCYVCFDAHRSDDDAPYIYVTEDQGATWKPIRGNLPTGSTRCLREDLYNPDVLYLGTEFAVWASIDRGATWTKINSNLPTVAVHELAQHPTAGEMVAATHGRSLWVLDVTPLRQLKPETARAPATLLAPNTVVRWHREPMRGTMYGMGARGYVGENPQPGAHIFYSLTGKSQKVSLTVQDFTGKTVATLPVRSEPGLHRIPWNLFPGDQRAARGAGGRGGPGGAAGGGGFRRGGFAGGRAAAAGQYRVVLNVDGKELVQGLKIENDPTLPVGTTIAEPEEAARKRRQVDD